MSKKSLFILLTGLVVLFSCQPEPQNLEPCNGSHNISYKINNGTDHYSCTWVEYDEYYNIYYIRIYLGSAIVYMTFYGTLSEGVYPINLTSGGPHTATAGYIVLPFAWYPQENYPADSGEINITSTNLLTSGSFYFHCDHPDYINGLNYSDGQMDAIPFEFN